ncbi:MULTISPECIES: DUF1385 domain-containing protein [Congzhengia]|uniref:DUF1385 domain-containing protein n=1 Tax=Congzhengia minquanensis TaxID=2763657 RepID=A0A926HZ24_9FIRM|nr:DUF1385 domain-containing protein [Congzhengia minquanensis]MBC8540396.1 DUF1385 domain-containing protein [Congzhengia minquanensis]
MSRNESKSCHITSIGGQAVIEGVMMRGPKETAIAVRKPDGEIIVEKKPINSFVQKFKINKIPIVRGVFSFFESLIVGTKALMFSAEFYDVEDEDDKKKKETMTAEELEAYNKKNDKMMTGAIFVSVAVALIFGIGVFMLLPTFLVGLLRDYAHLTNNIAATLLEGVVRIVIFVIYILLVSKMKDIHRVFQYHGAEHKTIFCYENGDDLTVENVKKQGRLHPRCGTSFLILVMIISIIVFSFVSWENPIQRVIIRLLLLPLVAGLSYELIKFAGRHSGAIVDIISAPGMWLQKITTAEPDESQIEVAIASLKSVLTGNKNDDKW